MAKWKEYKPQELITRWRVDNEVYVDAEPVYMEIYDEEHGVMHAARLPKLGITAYGRTEEEAHAKLPRMLKSKLRAHYQAGHMEEYLDRMEVPWGEQVNE